MSQLHRSTGEVQAMDALQRARKRKAGPALRPITIHLHTAASCPTHRLLAAAHHTSYARSQPPIASGLERPKP